MIKAIIAILTSAFTYGQGLSSSGPDFHKQLDWKGAGACVVEFVHTPCRTVRYHECSFGSGFGPEGVTRSERVEAFDHDGSESKTWTAVRSRYWFFPHETKITELILRKENQIVTIDHDKRIYQVRAGGANRGTPYWEEDDSQCSQTKSHYTYLSGRLADSTVAGIHVVGYHGRDVKGADYEIYFAPSIGCQTMRDQMAMRGVLGRKTGESDTVVDSYELGPPAPSLYAVPRATGGLTQFCPDSRLSPPLLSGFRSAKTAAEAGAAS